MDKEFLKKIEQQEETPIKNRHVRDLLEDNKDKVVFAVNALAKTPEESRAETELITLVRHWNDDDGYASLWAIIILGTLHSQQAISPLLSVLDSDADYWKEAATEALEEIAPHHPDTMMPAVSEFIEDRMRHDPFSARLYAYSAIRAVKNDAAKNFLIRHFEDDTMWRGSIACDLAHFDDERILEVFKRGMNFARKSGDKFLLNELREAYLMADGDPLDLRASGEKKSWENRWDFILKRLGKSEKEREEDEKKSLQAIEGKEKMFDQDKNFREKIKKEKEIINTHPIPPLNLDEYWSIRVRGAEEEDMACAMRLTGLDERWTVEEVQQLMNEATSISVAFEHVLGDFEFPTENGTREFFRLFAELWNATPRAEFEGLTPEEMNEIRGVNDVFQNAGRNDPCPCGSGRKFKKCHGGQR